MIRPEDICIGICSKAQQIEVLCVLGLCAVYAEGRVTRPPLMLLGSSDVAAARATLVHRFMTQTDCEWLVLIDDDVGFRLDDWDTLMAGDDLAVCAEYLKKIDGHRYPVQYGLGFCRIHRNVFVALQALETSDGQAWVRQGIYGGELMWWYFPQGIDSTGRYVPEDHAFWTLVHAAAIPVRTETSTTLVHTGPSRWRYDPDSLEDPSTEQRLGRSP